MKIGHTADKTAPLAQAPGHAASATTGAASAASASAIPTQADPSLKVGLSDTASTLLSTGSTPEFDAEKVAKMSKAIEDGTFKIDPSAIADKLISNAHELLNKFQS